MNRSPSFIHCSLSSNRIEKLVVFLGYLSGPESVCRGALSTRIAKLLLCNCRPSPNDIHDPDRTRLHARDAHGTSRRCYDMYASAVSMKGNRHKRKGLRSLSLRSPQTWDSEQVPDFMGLWCDRLLLGDHRHPHRVALLEPRVPAQFYAQSVMRVAQSYRHLRQEDVLVVSATPRLPFGMVRMVDGVGADKVGAPIQNDGEAFNTDESSSKLVDCSTIAYAIQHFHKSNNRCSSLLIGIGKEAGLRARFTAEEETRLKLCLIPLATFGCALWSVNKQKSAEYLQRMTETADSLRQENTNHRLWRTMQAGMLSTRDTTLLNAYRDGTPLDARLSAQHTEYLAQTLLHRLHEGDRMS